MPLPDERPRATVANLIGRFEQQNKRHSLSAASNASPSRSSSVVSNITGDSAKEEVKEKREWPPKSAVIPDSSSPLAPPAPIYGSAFWSRPKTAAAADSPSNITSSDTSISSTNVSSSPTDKPEPNVPAEPPSSPTPQPQAVAPAVQSPRATKTAVRTTVKHAATPRSSMTLINLQHTGQSVTSTSLPKPKVVPSTPKSSRSSGVPTTPSSVRPKTPGSVAAAPAHPQVDLKLHLLVYLRLLLHLWPERVLVRPSLLPRHERSRSAAQRPKDSASLLPPLCPKRDPPRL
ncbi:hypothetical protein C8R41DRAFT_514551 [Lentinula lateritia]|uniref:Uncharacterized protein n=1 Tax=Lentinula lateritia TaxID=40482 RepID=A0ABQ8VAK1_9AGAR|nr:hypothetical protein C8R41DRAFT_514551 [Lentinula lateritia]